MRYFKIVGKNIFFKKKKRNYTYILGIQFQTSQIFNGNKTTTAAVQT